MAKEEEESLEKITEEVWKGFKSPKRLSVKRVTSILGKLASYFGGRGVLPTKGKKGSHFEVEIIPNYKITVAPRRRGKEYVVSSGVLDSILDRISERKHIPYEQLKLYIFGAKKPYKAKFRREFEKEYFAKKK